MAASLDSRSLAVGALVGAASAFAIHRLRSRTPRKQTEKDANAYTVRDFKYRPPQVAEEDADPPTASDDPILEKDAVRKTIYAAPVPGSAKIEFDFLEGFICAALEAHGVSKDDAAVAADVLIASDKRGIDSHGIGRLEPIYCERIRAGILKPHSQVSVVSESNTTAVLDGNGGLGLVIGPKAMALAIRKAKEHGIGFVAVRNSSHYGFAGYYPLMADAQGCVGITGTNARPSIAPTYGVQPVMGTNPLVFGLPTDEAFPFVLDCATSVNQRGKIERYARENKQTPAGAVIGDDGAELTDPNVILDRMIKGTASFTPLGGAGHGMAGYKGYGYAAVVEMLCSALQDNPFGAALSDKYVDAEGKTMRQPSVLGHFFVAIDVERFVPLAQFKQRTGEIIRGFRASKPDPRAGGRIYTAGEPEHLAWAHRSRNGGTVVPPALIRDMTALRERSPAMRERFAQFPWEEGA